MGFAVDHEAQDSVGGGWLSLAALGVSAADVTAMVAEAGWPSSIGVSDVRVSTVAYRLATPATAALLRVAGITDHGEPWSLFCKVIQHPGHWLATRNLPADIARTLVSAYPWRQELGLWDEAFTDTMPGGMRAPRLHRVIELGDDRLALWMEDVHPEPVEWDVARFAHAARLLGQWNQRATDPAVVAATGNTPHFGLHTFAGSMLRRRGLEPLADDTLWAHPRLAEAHETRALLQSLAPHLEAFITRLDSMTLCRPHGDACPQNLLVPSASPDTFVAIDISQQAPTALGCDLAQLVVGLVHAGTMPSTDLPAIASVCLTQYIAGLRAASWDEDESDIERAFWTALLIRSGFDSLPYEELRATTTAATIPVSLNERLALTTFIATRATTALLS